MRLSVAGWTAVAFGVLVLMIAAAFLGPAATLQTKMTQRFLEAEAVRAREESAARQRQAQQEERRRLQAQHNTLLGEWFDLVEFYWADITRLSERAEEVQSDILAAARRVDPRSLRDPLSVDNYTTYRPCTDPAPETWWLGTPAQLRDRHIVTCAYHVAAHSNGSTAPLRLSMPVLLQRSQTPGRDTQEQFPLHHFVSMIWIGLIQHYTGRGEAIPMPLPRPTMLVGDTLQINPDLFPVFPPGFARRLAETASEREKIELHTTHFRGIQRLYEMAPQLVTLCRTLQHPDCLRRI